MNLRSMRILLLIAALCCGISAFGQNLAISFSETPDFINICGDADTMIVRVSLDGASPETRANISADIDFFKGVRFTEIIPSLTTAGVVLNNQVDPGNISITLPDLNPAFSFADVAFLVTADCTYQDSLNANNTAQVLDVWDFVYDMGIVTNLTESDITQQYRDAFRNPQFQVEALTTLPPLRVTDCFTREFRVSNGGLQGYADSLIYTAKQGSGLSITRILANGIALPITKTLSATDSDTIVTAVLNSTHFALNTSGNGDGRFHPAESLIITEELCYITCSGSLGSLHTIGWGCYEVICDSADENQFLDSGGEEGIPAATIINHDASSFVDLGYCQSGSRAFEVTNSGSEFTNGFGTMMSIDAAVVIGNGSGVVSDGIAITEVTIAGVVLSSPEVENRLDSLLAFTVDPDGPGVGLEDEDGDGYFDDLPIGNSFVVEYLFENQVLNRNAFDIDSNCSVNDISTQIFSRIQWKDACNDNKQTESSRYRIQNLTDETVIVPDADAYTNGDTFNIIITVDRSVRGFESNCGANELYIVKAALSPGMIPVDSEMSLFIEVLGSTVPVVSQTIDNDTLILEFDVSSAPLNGEYTSNLAFTLNCDITEGRLILPVTTEYFCPTCADSHLWYCEDIIGPQVHFTSPECPIPPCSEGIRALSFEINRTTFGYSDTEFTVPYDPELANKKVAVECDSVEIKISAEVGDSAITDSAFVKISYSNADMSNSSDETFLFGGGSVLLKRGAVIIGEEPLGISDLSFVSMDEDKELFFNLDGAITDMGTSLMPGDSLFFIGTFQLNSSGPFDNQFVQIPNFRGEMLSVRDGVSYSCDNFGEMFTIAKVSNSISFPLTTTWPQGSDEGLVSFVINPPLFGFSTYFTDELRPSVKVDSLVILFDQNILNVYETFEPEVAIPNHPIHGQNHYPAPGFDEFPDGRYVLRFDTVTTLPRLNQPRSSEFSFRIRVVGSSEAIKGSSTGDSLYNWEPTLYYSDKYYAKSIGDGSCSIDNAHEAATDYFLFNLTPNVQPNPISDPNPISIGDTLTYDIRVCNNSSLERAEITWISFVDSLSAFDLYSIDDISDLSNIQPLPINQFGTVNSWFGFADGLNQNICRDFRIKGKLNTCGLHNFQVNTGWNSVPYSNPSWTPDSIVNATVTTTSLTARSQDGNLDGAILQQPTQDLELCDVNELVIVVRNTNLGKVFDINTRLFLPSPGFTLVPGSVEIAYPSSATFVSAIADPVLTGTELRGDIYEYGDFSTLHGGLDVNGLDGFDSSDPTSSDNEFLLRFQFTTECNFLSGSQIFYDVQGVLGCGDASNYESGETSPIELSLSNADAGLAYALRFDPKAAFVSNSDGQLNVIINNIGTVPSSAADSVEIRLPNNFGYVSGSANAVIPASYNLGDPVISDDGPIVSYIWGLPAGVPGGDSIAFNFMVTSPIVDCGIDSIGVVAFTRANVSATCSTTSTACDIEVVTSDASGSIVTELPIFNQTLLVRENEVTSSCASLSTENIYIDGAIENIGNAVNDTEVTLYYKIDDDGDQLADANDVVVDSIKFAGPVLAGQTLVWQDTLMMSSIEICGLYLFGDTTYLGGCDPLVYFMPAPRVLNAGADIEHCSLSANTLSYQLGNDDCAPNPEFTYTWSSSVIGADAFLSNTNIGTPTFSYVYDGTIDTLEYVLETVRDGCLATRDTILIDMATCRCVAPVITTEVVTASRCNESVGGVSIGLLQDEALYTYTYTELFSNTTLVVNSSEVAGIPGGAYKVIIEDTFTGGSCSDSTLIAVPNIDGPQATYITTNASCNAADGSVSLSPISYTYIWNDGSTGANRNDLLAGKYVVQVESPDVPGCFNYIGIEIGVDNDLSAIFEIDNFATCGVADGVGTITVTGGSGSYSYSWIGGTSTNSAMESGVTLVTITDTDATACELILPVLMTNGDQAATTISNTTNISCIGNQDGEVTYDFVYELGFATPVDTVITDGTNVYVNGTLPEGYYCITIVDGLGCIYGGDCFEVTSPDPLGVEVILDPSCAMNRGITLIPTGGAGDYAVDWADLPDTNDPFNRNGLAEGTYSFTITDENDCELTLDNLSLGACNSQTTYFVDTILIDEMPVFCIDPLSLSFSAPITSIENTCTVSSDDNVNFAIDQVEACVTYTGLSVGRDSACIVICDATMNCDTIIMVVDVVAGEFIQDTVIRLTDTITYGLNTSALAGNIIDIVDNCPGNHGTEVNFIVDDVANEVTYYGIGLGIDTLCIEMLDDLGFSYSTTFVVSSRDPIREIYTDTIYSNQEVSYLFDISELGVTAGSMVNECVTASDTSVAFVYSDESFVIDYIGVLPGTDTACIVSCNAAGVCDTLEMRIHVNFFPDPPIAVEDSVRTLIGTPVNINVQINDTVFGALYDLALIDQPQWGDSEAFINLDGSVTYNPDPDFCERWDYFRYEICNENTCDTAYVRVFIECTDIKIFNALSPNDDGHNDYFHIANIDDFPNNVLRIYNRWNVLVYEMEEYSVVEKAKRWKGTWQDETDLPDGTYYYHLILNDADKREFSGFLTIFR